MLLLGITAECVSSVDLHAQSRCEGLLSYSWSNLEAGVGTAAAPDSKEKSDPKVKPESQEKPAAGNGSKADKTESESKQSFAIKVVPLRKLEAHGATEEEAKQKLAERESRSIIEAVQICRQRHENYAGCIGSRYTQLAGQVNALSFTARRQLEDAIKSECDAIRGTCLKGEVTDRKCTTQAAAVTPEAAAEEAPPKEEKKKK